MYISMYGCMYQCMNVSLCLRCKYKKGSYFLISFRCIGCKCVFRCGRWIDLILMAHSAGIICGHHDVASMRQQRTEQLRKSVAHASTRLKYFLTHPPSHKRAAPP